MNQSIIVRPKKQKYFSKITKFYKNFKKPIIYLFSIENVFISNYNTLRKRLLEKYGVKTLKIKNSYLRLFLRLNNIKFDEKIITDQILVGFSEDDINLYEVFLNLKKYRSENLIKYKLNQKVENDVIIKKGNTGIRPSNKLTALKQVLDITLIKGFMNIVEDVCLIKNGDTVNIRTKEIMDELFLELFNSGFEIKFILKNNITYTNSNFKIVENIIEKIYTNKIKINNIVEAIDFLSSVVLRRKIKRIKSKIKKLNEKWNPQK